MGYLGATKGPIQARGYLGTTYNATKVIPKGFLKYFLG